jgi:hypothetical protein
VTPTAAATAEVATIVARLKNPRCIGWRFYLFVDLIGSLESPPSN